MVKLEEMRPLEIQDACARDVPLLLPVGVLENHGYHNPCGLDLLCCRGTCELVAERIEAVVVRIYLRVVAHALSSRCLT